MLKSSAMCPSIHIIIIPSFCLFRPSFVPPPFHIRIFDDQPIHPHSYVFFTIRLIHTAFVHRYLMMLAKMLLQGFSTVLRFASQILVAIDAVGQSGAFSHSHVDAMVVDQVLGDFGIRPQMAIAMVAVGHGGDCCVGVSAAEANSVVSLRT
jgi:hypothetical protein